MPPSRPCSAGEWIGAARGCGMSGSIRAGACGRGLAPQRERRARGRRSARGWGSDLRASPQVPPAAGRREVLAGRGRRAGGCGAVCSHWLDKWEPHGGGQPGPGVSGERTTLAPGPRAPLTGGPGSRGAPAQAWGQWLLPSDAPFPKGGRCSPAWRCGDRCGSGQNPFTWMAIASARRLPVLSQRRGDRTHTPPPSVPRRCRPSHLPLPFSDSTTGSLALALGKN